MADSTRQRVNPDDLMNPQEAARMLGVNLSYIKNHCTRLNPRLPYVRLGGGRYEMRRFRRTDLLKFIEDNLVNGEKK